MTYKFPKDIDQIVAERMASGDYGSEDELLRDAFRALVEEDEDLQAVRDAVAELDAGDAGTPLGDAFEAIRRGRSVASER